MPPSNPAVPAAEWAERLEKVAAALLPRQEKATLNRFREILVPLCKYLDLLAVWNQRFDLTAARSADELVDLTLADALMLALETSSQPVRCVDVGSGAGAPALPLAMLRPAMRLTLVEPKAKRVAFLRTVAASLELTNVSVVRGRSEVLPAASFNVAMSRATLAPEAWLVEGARLATGSVWVLLGRGAAPVLEGWHAVSERAYQLPLTGAQRRILRYERV